MSVTKAAIVSVQSREYDDYDDAGSEYSSGADTSRQQPLGDFGSPATLVEDNVSPRSRRTMKGFWRESIGGHSRRTQSVDDVEDEVKQGLLASSQSRRKAKKRPWYIYCMFGGLGCLTLS